MHRPPCDAPRWPPPPRNHSARHSFLSRSWLRTERVLNGFDHPPLRMPLPGLGPWPSNPSPCLSPSSRLADHCCPITFFRLTAILPSPPVNGWAVQVLEGGSQASPPLALAAAHLSLPLSLKL